MSDWTDSFQSNWIDSLQNRRIRRLEEDLERTSTYMASQRTRLRSELSRVRGTLEQRLDRVSASLDAFIELSDIRATLGMFNDAAIVRHRTLQLLDGASVPHLHLPEVPGYWLVPAAHGLHALLNDAPDTARARFDEAARCDPVRAHYFAVLATALTRTGYAHALGGASAELLPHLPAPSEEATRAQRALWLLTADGSLGEDARERLLLGTMRHWSAQQVSAPVPSVMTAHADSPAVSARAQRRSAAASRGKASGIDQRAQAARKITALRENVARVTALGDESPLGQAPTPDEADVTFLEQTLRLLVEEGSAEEKPLLARAGELRAVIENSGDGGRQPQWDETVGSVGSLLGDDLVHQGVSAHRRTFALVLQRPAVLDSAEELVRQASAPVEDRTTLAVQGVRVTITSDGAEPHELERATRLVRARWAYEGSARQYLWGFLALSGLLAVLGLVSASALAWLLCAGTAVAAVVALVVDGRGRAAAREAAEVQCDRLRGSITEAAEKWRQSLADSDRHADTAEREAAQIRRLLNP